MDIVSTQRERWSAKARLLLTPALAAEEGGLWADLGCGDGIFTFLLDELLTPGSHLYAVDRDRLALERVTQRAGTLILSSTLTALHADFTRPLHLPPLDGILLANSLHFVKEKQPVVDSLLTRLKPKGKLVVVEYNTRQGNYAVPHPLDETDFLKLVEAAGLSEAQIVARAPSTFLGEMFTGVIVKPA